MSRRAIVTGAAIALRHAPATEIAALVASGAGRLLREALLQDLGQLGL